MILLSNKIINKIECGGNVDESRHESVMWAQDAAPPAIKAETIKLK